MAGKVYETYHEAVFVLAGFGRGRQGMVHGDGGIKKLCIRVTNENVVCHHIESRFTHETLTSVGKVQRSYVT